jgi:hypothetical protein
MAYWYGFRQVIPAPPGRWIASGPYPDRATALRAYEHAKLAPDGQVAPPFEADSQAEADQIAARQNRTE